MPNQASTSKLTFTRCSKWSTKSCPNLRNLKMEQWFQFDDQTVKDMNRLCDSCEEFQSKTEEI